MFGCAAQAEGEDAWPSLQGGPTGSMTMRWAAGRCRSRGVTIGCSYDRNWEAARPPMLPRYDRVVTDFGEPARTSHISRMVLSI